MMYLTRARYTNRWTLLMAMLICNRDITKRNLMISRKWSCCFSVVLLLAVVGVMFHNKQSILVFIEGKVRVMMRVGFCLLSSLSVDSTKPIDSSVGEESYAYPCESVRVTSDLLRHNWHEKRRKRRMITTNGCQTTNDNSCFFSLESSSKGTVV